MNKQINTSYLNSQFQRIAQAQADLLNIYPRIKERKATLSMLGINPRTFLHWKENGLVWHEDTDSEIRTWVRLNVYEYVWLKAVIAMREFGVPLDNIRAFREQIEKSIFSIYKEADAGFAERLGEETELSKEQIAGIEKSIAYAVEQEKNLSPEDRQSISFLGSMINRMLLLQDKVNILIIRKEDGFTIDLISQQDSTRFEESSSWTAGPHLSIPLYPFVVDMINEPKNEINLQEWGLINANEQKVLDAVRRKDFREIVIKTLQGSDDFIIELTTDEMVMGEKAQRLKTILGLDQYSEVTIKYRNDKHLFFRNTKKL